MGLSDSASNAMVQSDQIVVREGQAYAERNWQRLDHHL